MFDAKVPDGTLVPSETYAFGTGGQWGGELIDATIDKLTFPRDGPSTIAISPRAKHEIHMPADLIPR